MRRTASTLALSAFLMILSIPVLANGQAWNWNSLGMPLGIYEPMQILISPLDENILYCVGFNPTWAPGALMMSRDKGLSWRLIREGGGGKIAIDFKNPQIVYAGLGSVDGDYTELLKSEDGGLTWVKKHEFPPPYGITVLLVSPLNHNELYVGHGNKNDPGISKSEDGGENWTFYPFSEPSIGDREFIDWDIAQDPINGFLYVGGEFASPPKDNPPILRSKDGGKTWENIRNGISWHVVHFEINPFNQYVFALQESGPIFMSSNFGDSWVQQNAQVRPGPGVTILLDKNNPNTIYGGDLAGWYGVDLPGALVSYDSAQSFSSMGLMKTSVYYFALNNASTMLFAGTSKGLFSLDLADRSSRNPRIWIYADSGGSTSPPPGSYPCSLGSKMTIQAIPSENSEFLGWSGGIDWQNRLNNPIEVVADMDRSVKAVFARHIFSPLDFRGEKKANRGLLVGEYIISLSWKTNAANEGLDILNYRIYLLEGENKNLLCELQSSQFNYLHKGVDGKKRYIYAICAVDAAGREGDLAYVTVN